MKPNSLFHPLHRAALLGLLALTTYSAHAGPRVLRDKELDTVHGGVAPQSNTKTRSSSSERAPALAPASGPSILMSGHAQQNLTAMVNVAAVNSSVQVLMNLNISINSRVNSVGQGNSGLQHSR
jgi:hypothetical protein